MEPGHEDREYAGRPHLEATVATPQWSPVMKTGNTRSHSVGVAPVREPQWSPVMKTGNTILS